jgi:hypothetical protein
LWLTATFVLYLRKSMTSLSSRLFPVMTTAADNDTTGGQNLLAYRVTLLEQAVSEIRDAIKSIDTSLRGFAMVQAQYSETRGALNKAFTEIEGLEKQVQAFAVELPTLQLVRTWVIGGVVGIVSLLGTAALALVLR